MFTLLGWVARPDRPSDISTWVGGKTGPPLFSYYGKTAQDFECKHDKTQIECFFLEKDLKCGKMPRGLSEINTFACCDYECLFISHCILYLPCKFNYICRNLKITIVCTMQYAV